MPLGESITSYLKQDVDFLSGWLQSTYRKKYLFLKILNIIRNSPIADNLIVISKRNTLQYFELLKNEGRILK